MNELTDDHIRRLLDALSGHEGGATIHLRDGGGARCGDNSVPLATVTDPAMVTCPACRLFASLPHISPCATEQAAMYAAPPPPLPPPAPHRSPGRGELLAAGVGALGAGILILACALWIHGSGPSSVALDTPPAPTAAATPTAAAQEVVSTPAPTPEPTVAPTAAPTPEIQTVTVTTTVTSTSTVVEPPPPPAQVVVTQVNGDQSEPTPASSPTPAASPAASADPTAVPDAQAAG